MPRTPRTVSRVRTTLLVFLAVQPFPAGAGHWYPGIIHVHTTFSDGSDNVPQRVAKAKRLGCRYVVITDHYEQIGEGEKKPAKWPWRLVNPGGVDVGFADYARNCREQTEDGSFVAIPGAEIEAHWNAEPDTEDASHTLALGPIPDHLDEDLATAQCTLGGQQRIIARSNALGLLPVAAHPTLIATLSLRSRPWEWQRNRYDRRTKAAYEGLRGVEMFNSWTAQQSEEAVRWYLSLVQEGRSTFVTSGCDSHGWGDPGDEKRWERVTWIYAKELTSAGLRQALSEGRTYAARHGARFAELSPVPGERRQMARAALKAEVRFDKPAESAKEFVVYRDGFLVEESRKPLGPGATRYRYQWTDSAAPAGWHTYVLRVSEVLITSPAFVRATEGPGAFYVVETHPADGASDVPVDEDIAFTFSGTPDLYSFIQPRPQVAIDPPVTMRSIGGPLFAFRDPGDDKTVSWLMVNYRPNMTYTVRLTKGIKSNRGQPLGEEFAFRFTTGTRYKWKVVREEPRGKNRLNRVVIGKLSPEQKLTNLPVIPKYPTRVFGCHDWVYVYLAFGDLAPGEHKLELHWYDPGGKLFLRQEDELDTEKRADLLPGYQIGFYRFPGILGDAPGKWKIDLIWDAKRIRTLEFERRASGS